MEMWLTLSYVNTRFYVLFILNLSSLLLLFTIYLYGYKLNFFKFKFVCLHSNLLLTLCINWTQTTLRLRCEFIIGYCKYLLTGEVSRSNCVCVCVCVYVPTMFIAFLLFSRLSFRLFFSCLFNHRGMGSIRCHTFSGIVNQSWATKQWRTQPKFLLTKMKGSFQTLLANWTQTLSLTTLLLLAWLQLQMHLVQILLLLKGLRRWRCTFCAESGRVTYLLSESSLVSSRSYRKKKSNVRQIL